MALVCSIADIDLELQKIKYTDILEYGKLYPGKEVAEKLKDIIPVIDPPMFDEDGNCRYYD